MKRNWGTAFTAAWEKVDDPNPERRKEKQRRAYEMLQWEYADVLANASREVVDEAIAMARGFHRDFPPRPPQLRAILDQVQEQRRVANADREEAERKKLALAAPAPDPEKARDGRNWLKQFVTRGGNVKPKAEVTEGVNHDRTQH